MGPGGPCAVLTLYLDDRGNQDPDSVFVMGALIANESQWKTFSEQWDMALRAAGIESFHATEFFARKGLPFRTWTNVQHRNF